MPGRAGLELTAGLTRLERPTEVHRSRAHRPYVDRPDPLGALRVAHVCLAARADGLDTPLTHRDRVDVRARVLPLEAYYVGARRAGQREPLRGRKAVKVAHGT